MEVTSSNYDQVFPLIAESIRDADFIALDTEFSGKRSFQFLKSTIGHSLGPDDKGHEYDTVEERYQKLRYTCQKFIAF